MEANGKFPNKLNNKINAFYLILSWNKHKERIILLIELILTARNSFKMNNTALLLQKIVYGIELTEAEICNERK